MTKRLAGLCPRISTVMGAPSPFATYWRLSASLPCAFSAWWIHFSPYFSPPSLREKTFPQMPGLVLSPLENGWFLYAKIWQHVWNSSAALNGVSRRRKEEQEPCGVRTMESPSTGWKHIDITRVFSEKILWASAPLLFLLILDLKRNRAKVVCAWWTRMCRSGRHVTELHLHRPFSSLYTKYLIPGTRPSASSLTEGTGPFRPKIHGQAGPAGWQGQFPQSLHFYKALSEKRERKDYATG